MTHEEREQQHFQMALSTRLLTNGYVHPRVSLPALDPVRTWHTCATTHDARKLNTELSQMGWPPIATASMSRTGFPVTRMARHVRACGMTRGFLMPTVYASDLGCAEHTGINLLVRNLWRGDD